VNDYTGFGQDIVAGVTIRFNVFHGTDTAKVIYRDEYWLYVSQGRGIFKLEPAGVLGVV